MKHLAVFILALAVEALAPAKACGPFYPYGDEVRFCLLRPDYYEQHGMEDFRFSTSFFRDVPMQSVKRGQDVNVAFWRKRTGSSLPDAVIREAIYSSEKELKGTRFSNKFLLELTAKGDKSAIDYLRFANSCTPANTFYEDAWERKSQITAATRKQLIAEALKRAGTAKDPFAKRYAFLAIRLCYYSEDFATLKKTYTTYFASRTEKDIVDYWALYFRAIVDRSYERRNFDLAQVFAYAPDKRFVVTQKFRTSIGIEELLQLARTNEEKSALWLTYGIMEPSRASEHIRNVYALTPKAEELSTLLLREVNKIEDWILTPYYSNFGVPTENLSFYYSSSYDEYSYENRLKQYKEQLEKDRNYATGLLKLLGECDPAKTADPLLWKTSIAYLEFITGNHKAALSQVEKVLPDAKPGTAHRDVLEQIRALCLIAKQSGKPTIPQEIEETLMEASRKGNNTFLFAVARELEFRGNTTDAALLLSQTNQTGSHSAVWRSPKGVRSGFFDVYYNYFSYLDVAYTVEQTEAFVQKVAAAKPGNPFSNWLTARAKAELSLLYDLLGTKKMRVNDFPGALAAFKQVNDTVWTSDHLPYERWLDANPFYTNNYNEHARTPADDKPYDKISILEELLMHLRKAEDPSEPHRDYHYFLVANCELNMTFHGNSWLMKRYWWSNAEKDYDSGMEDNENYYTCERAKQYYLKAKAVSKSKQFQALSLRMAGRCEKYRLMRQHSREGTSNDYGDEISYEMRLQSENQYYIQMEQEYNDDYFRLLNNCEAFDRYFATYKQ